MRNLTFFEMCQVLQIVVFFATGGNSHSQFKYKAILYNKMTDTSKTLMEIDQIDSKIENSVFPANVNSDKKTKKDEQTRSKKSFYENLPFQGLKSPPSKVQLKLICLQILNFVPEQVISPPPSEDNLDYADADYKDLYVEGPKGYRKIPDSKPKLSSSQENANGL